MTDNTKTPQPQKSGKKDIDIHVPTDEETARFGDKLQLPTGQDVEIYGSTVQIATLGEIQEYAATMPKKETARLREMFGDPDKKKHNAMNMLLEMTDGDINQDSIAKVHRLIDEAALRFIQHKESGLSNMNLVLTGHLDADTANPFGNGDALARRFSKISMTEGTAEEEKKTQASRPKGDKPQIRKR
ncbi:MAG: hypothetical protein HND56_08235 [Pseudomonadota bacterium]|nr:hypothetical protein [Pseudomonadota bacterium]QKK05676.1 MAG: hypothetical protein HND56_08235 [Pseudomonadota bacterium]